MTMRALLLVIGFCVLQSGCREATASPGGGLTGKPSGRFSVSLAPSTDNTLDLGTAALRWNDVHVESLKANTTSYRISLQASDGNLHRGESTDGAGAIAHQFGNTNALSNATAKIAVWHSDNLSTAKATLFANGDYTVTGAATATQHRVSATTGGGTITLAAGSGTATVFSGARCVCTDTTANASVKCAVSGTTLTATGTATDVIAYLCF